MNALDPFGELQKLAETTAHDIGNDIKANAMPSDDPNYEPDIGYNLYVENLPNDTSPQRMLYGVIDMGDLYHEAFVWWGDSWELSNRDSYAIEDEILARRGVR